MELNFGSSTFSASILLTIKPGKDVEDRGKKNDGDKGDGNKKSSSNGNSDKGNKSN